MTAASSSEWPCPVCGSGSSGVPRAPGQYHAHDHYRHVGTLRPDADDRLSVLADADGVVLVCREPRSGFIEVRNLEETWLKLSRDEATQLAILLTRSAEP